MPSVLDIKQIVQLGGGVSIDATSISTLDIKQTVSLAAQSGATVIIRNAASMSTLDIKQTAALAPGKVIFEF